MTATVMTVMVKGKMEWEEGSARSLAAGGRGGPRPGDRRKKEKREVHFHSGGFSENAPLPLLFLPPARRSQTASSRREIQNAAPTTAIDRGEGEIAVKSCAAPKEA